MAQDVNQSETDVAAQVRSALVERISTERYDLWMPQSTTWNFEQSVLTLGFENDFHCQLAKRMLFTDVAHVANEIAPDVEIRFELLAPGVANPASPTRGAAAENTASDSIVAGAENRHTDLRRIDQRSELQPPHVNRRQASGQPNAASLVHPAVAVDNAQPRLQSQESCWSQFISGSSNQLAWATAKLVVADPGKMSPVLIHGPSGSGKSLLAEGMSQQLRTTRRMRRVVHMSSEQFTNDFTDGLRGGGLPMFRRKYRDVEALILEDIHFFAGKKSTLTEVKHTLDNLIRLGKQVVLTADRSLNELAPLGNDLLGRIRGGLMSPIFPLDEATRFELLKRDCEAASVDIGEDVLRNIAERVTGDGRVISGIVKRLAAVASLQQMDGASGEPRKLDWEYCWSAVHDLVQATQPIVRLVDIERVVCDVFGLEPDSLQSQTKMRTVSQPRMLAMFLARKYTPAAYKEIGDFFGHRRHSTVISAEKTVEGWLVDGSQAKIGRGLSVKDAIRHVESQLQVG